MPRLSVLQSSRCLLLCWDMDIVSQAAANPPAELSNLALQTSTLLTPVPRLALPLCSALQVEDMAVSIFERHQVMMS